MLAGVVLVWLGGHHWYAGPLLVLPIFVKLAVATWFLGFRKAWVPEGAPMFLPFSDRGTATGALWIEVVAVIVAVTALVALVVRI